jgi:hypothetical protein
MPRLPFRAMPDPVYDPAEAETAAPSAEDAARGRMAMARLAEAERELALARRHQEARIAELEDRLAWIEEHELDLRDEAERRPWLAALLRVWARSVKLARRASRSLRR